MPATLRGRLLNVAQLKRGSALNALGLAAAGRRMEARRTLTDLVEHGSARSALRAAEVATVLNEQSLARLALSRAPTAGRSGLLLAEARLLWAEGHLSRACKVAGQAPGRRGRRLARRLDGDRAALIPQRRVPIIGATDRTARWSTSGAGCQVLHVVTKALPEVQVGYTLRTQGIAEAQAVAGYDVHVVTRLGFPVDIGVLGSPDRLTRNSVTYHRLQPAGGLPSSAGLRLDQGIAALHQLVTRVRPDVLHAHSKHDNAQVALAVGRRVGLPVLYEARGFLEETWRTQGGDVNSDRYQMSRDAETWCMQQADLVVALSETMRTEITRRGVDANHVLVVPNAVSETVLGSEADGAATRRHLGISETAFVIGVVSTLNDYEGVDTLLAALRLVEHPDTHLLVVGDGPSAADLHTSSTDLAGRVTFTGKVPHADVADHYAAIDVFCVPRHRTPVTELVPPLKPLEALAMAIPILVSDLPPLTELLADSDAGWAVAAEDPEAWANQIDWLHGHIDERRKKGREGRSWVSHQRTWAALVMSYERIYRQLGLAMATSI
ncbi:MAG TPA: glycosyltransferase family 4 protein [Propionibacteriaceae bacterium]|nr:glycosyltransferase family 4 protein [Propionibacteriaceae bacterium]